MATFNEGSVSELSLQHVLEDGLALTKGELPQGQRQLALEGIIEVFSEAIQGANIVSNRALFIKADEKTAFNTFSLIFNFLNRTYGEDLSRQLEQAKSVFESLDQNQPVSRELISSSSALLTTFLDALQLQQKLVPPLAPITYN